MESESVISEAVLNRAVRQDVLYMLMFLPHTHTLSLKAGPASFSDNALLPPAVMLGYIPWDIYPVVTMTTVERKGELRENI